jgi:hypothetical protein
MLGVGSTLVLYVRKSVILDIEKTFVRKSHTLDAKRTFILFIHFVRNFDARSILALDIRKRVGFEVSFTPQLRSSFGVEVRSGFRLRLWSSFRLKVRFVLDVRKRLFRHSAVLDVRDGRGLGLGTGPPDGREGVERLAGRVGTAAGVVVPALVRLIRRLVGDGAESQRLFPGRFGMPVIHGRIHGKRSARTISTSWPTFTTSPTMTIAGGRIPAAITRSATVDS